MGIFTNNITPIPPANRSWNKTGHEEWLTILNQKYKTGHEEWLTILNQKYIDRWRLENMCLSTHRETHRERWNKNELKRKLHQMKRLNRELQEAIDKVQDAVYQKYGVWIKYKIQYGDNKRIKSIAFNRFC